MHYYINIKINFILFYNIFNDINIMGIGDWGLGIGDLGLGPIPQTPNPKPQTHKPIYL